MESTVYLFTVYLFTVLQFIYLYHISQSGFEVLNAIFQASVYVTILPPLCITVCTTVSNFLNILVVVELLKKKLSFSRIKTIHLFTNPYSSLSPLDSI